MTVRQLAALAALAALCGGALLYALPSPGALRQAPPAARPAHPDVVLVTIDTLRADALGFAGNRRSQTPILDRLAASGRVFPDAHAHNVVTLPSHTNILTGLYPFQHGVRDNSGFRVPQTVPTLATVLKGEGYATGAFVGGFPLDSQFGLGHGFDVYDDHTSGGPEAESFVFAERRGDEVIGAALAWWHRQKGRPRFLWVHLFDPHAPYSPPEPFATRFASDLYLGEVAATDSFLSPLLLPLLDGREATRPFVVVTADHGESLGEHGELTHGLFAYEATLKVPLVLWGTGVTPGRDPRPARHVDIFPTVLQAAGVLPPAPAPGHVWPGRSLLTPASEPVDSYFEALSATFNRRWAPLRGMLHVGRKLISLPLPEVYDLAKDPHERRNLYSVEGAAARAALAKLPRDSAWLPHRTPLGTEEAARLRSLGYLMAGGDDLPTHFGHEDDPKLLVGIDQKMHQVIDLVSHGENERAVVLARAVVAERPSMPLAQTLLAQSLLAAGRAQEALAAMQKARRQGAASEQLLRQTGLTLAQLGRSAEALAILRPLANGGSPQALNALAVALSQAGRQQEAGQVARRVLAADPGNAKAQEQLGLIEIRQSHWKEAAELLQRAVEANPRLSIAWNNLGVALYQLGRPEPAFDAWNHALSLRPDLWDTLWNLGTKAAQHGFKQQASLALERFAAGAPKERYGDEIRLARLFLDQLRHGTPAR